LSSESDESDGFTSPSPEQLFVRVGSSSATAPRAMFEDLSLSDENSRRFLPHAPTSYDQRYQKHDQRQSPRDGIPTNPSSNPRKRRDSKHRRLQVGREANSMDGEDDEDADHAAPDALYKSFSTSSLLASCRLDDKDEGCLAGF
jgi:hypothetical protein